MAADDDNVDNTLVVVTLCITRNSSDSIISVCEMNVVHIFIVVAVAWLFSNMISAFQDSLVAGEVGGGDLLLV